MAFMRAVKRRARAAVPPLIFLSLTGYFGWSATQGERGLQAYVLRQKQLAEAQAQLATATAERDAWQRKVASLSSSHLDTDMLDERARSLLNLADPTDIVVPYPKGRKLF